MRCWISEPMQPIPVRPTGLSTLHRDTHPPTSAPAAAHPSDCTFRKKPAIRAALSLVARICSATRPLAVMRASAARSRGHCRRAAARRLALGCAGARVEHADATVHARRAAGRAEGRRAARHLGVRV